MSVPDDTSLYLSPDRHPHTPVRLARGDVIAGQYEMVAPLGSEARGGVYRARRLHDDGQVVLKVESWGVWDAHVEARFRKLREHWLTLPPQRGVVRLLDAGLIPKDGRAELFSVWEFVDGQALVDVSLTADRVWAVANALSEAIAHLHQNGLLHGDIHLGNIIVTDTSEFKLCDPLAFHAVDGAPRASRTANDDVQRFADVLEQLLARLPATAAFVRTPLTELIARCRSKGKRDRLKDGKAVVRQLEIARQAAGDQFAKQLQSIHELVERREHRKALATCEQLVADYPNWAAAVAAHEELQQRAAAATNVLPAVTEAMDGLPLDELRERLRESRRLFRDLAAATAVRRAVAGRLQSFRRRRRKALDLVAAGDLHTALLLLDECQHERPLVLQLKLQRAAVETALQLAAQAKTALHDAIDGGALDPALDALQRLLMAGKRLGVKPLARWSC